MLMLAAIALIVPAAFQAATGTAVKGLAWLSVSISVVLLVVYLLYLVFVTGHPSLAVRRLEAPEKEETAAPVGRAVLLLSARQWELPG